MTAWDYLFDILKISVPAGFVVIVVKVMLEKHFDDLSRRDNMSLYKDRKKDLRPLKMQAFERLILYLERLQPDNLMMRVQRPNMSARLLHTQMLKTIRQEYEHNMTQQLYVSESAWKLVLMAKDEVTKLVNLSASQLPEDASAVDLGNQMMNIMMKLEKMPTDVAIHGLKVEFLLEEEEFQ